jgi:hypothetical protein
MVRAVHFFSIEFPKKYKRKGLIDFRRSIREDVANPDVQTISVKPCRMIQACKGEEFNPDFGDGGSRPKFEMG